MSILKGLYPVERTHTGAVYKGLQPVEGTHIEQVMEDCLPWVGPHVGSGEECEEEGAAETMCDEMTSPIPITLHHSRERR